VETGFHEEYLVHKHPVVVNSNTQKTLSYTPTLKNVCLYKYKNALHISTLKWSSSGAESNELTIHVPRYMRMRNSDKRDTI
jgi:hypothetical protein